MQLKFNNTQKNLICLAIAAIIMAVLLLIKPAISFDPKGILLPSKRIDSVKITPFEGEMHIYSATPLSVYKNIGTINVMLHAIDSEPTKFNEERVVKYAMKLAAKYGANAIIIDQIFYVSPKMIDKSMTAYYLKGRAIVVNRSLDDY